MKPKKTILLALLVIVFPMSALPLAAFAAAQGGGPGPGPGAGPGAGQGRGAGPRGDPERMEKRMKLARTLGLAEALDLDAAQALKLGETIGKFDERRLALHKQMRDANQVLRRAAQGEKVAPAEVDTAIQQTLDARGQIQAIDREIVATVTKDLSPEKKARAVLFLGKFQRRFGMGPGMRHGGRGMGPGMGPGPRDGGPGGPGMGGQMGMGPGPGAWDDEDED